MTICNKIQTLGETMETNLNARGVSCIFGTGTGESTVLDMVEMVNGTNFKGSSDVNLKISANRPYLLTGETTDVVVKLENGLCEPLKNKNVTIEQSPFRDNGTTASHNDNWVKFNPNNFTITRGEEYTSVTGSNYRYGVPISNNCKIKVETRKTTQSTGTLLSIWGYNSTPLSASQLLLFSVTEMGMTQGTFANIEMTVTPTTVTVKNLDNDTTITKEYSTTYNLIFNFWGTTFDYKNFKVYETINGVTDGKGEFALYNVSVTGDTTFTASYGTETATTNVYLCQFADYGITSKHNDNWTLTTNMQRTRNDSYTTLSNIGSTSQMAYPINNTTKFSGDITIEWENYATTYQLNYLIIKGTSDAPRTFGTLGINKVCNVKITVIGTSVKSYIDGVQKDSYTINRDANNQFQVRLQINPNGNDIKYNNFRVR